MAFDGKRTRNVRDKSLIYCHSTIAQGVASTQPAAVCIQASAAFFISSLLSSFTRVAIPHW